LQCDVITDVYIQKKNTTNTLFSFLKEMLSFNSMFPNTDVILFFVKTVSDLLYYQSNYKGEITISKNYLQDIYIVYNNIEMD
jgi:hypothetical protein